MITLSRLRARLTGRTSYVLLAAGALLILLAALGVFLARQAYASDNFLRDEFQAKGRQTFTLVSDPTTVPGRPFALCVDFSSVSQNTVLTLRSVTIPGGLPSHLRLLGEGVTSVGVLGDREWPDPRLQPIHPIDGFRLLPGKEIFVVIAVSPQRDGIYTIGTETIHADVPGWFGIPVSIQMTYPQHGMLCVQISQAACDAAKQAFNNSH